MHYNNRTVQCNHAGGGVIADAQEWRGLAHAGEGAEVFAQGGDHFEGFLEDVHVDVEHGHGFGIAFAYLVVNAVVGYGDFIFDCIATPAQRLDIGL